MSAELSQPIQPVNKPPVCTVRVPGSKSITNRALVLASLAAPNAIGPQESSYLIGALRSEDTEIMAACLTQLGMGINCDWLASELIVEANGGRIPNPSAELYVGNSGTTMRFLTSFVALGKGRYRLDGIPRMRQRPIGDLLAALGQLGANAKSENDDGCPPVMVNGSGLPGGRAQIRGDLSSQFLSGLLMVAPLAKQDVTIEVDGVLVSQPYVNMTLAMMRQFGVDVNAEEMRRFHVPCGQAYKIRRYPIEPDASAASYFAAAAALLDGQVTLTGLTDDSIQGDIRFLQILEQMGCSVQFKEPGATVRAGKLRGIDVDMNDISDTVMTLAVCACFAEGPTTIRNVAHIRHKETDRLSALARELQKIGAGVEERPDGLTIHPKQLRGAEIETYNDHRMAMSFALAGLRVPGIVIKNPACTGKTYPDFFKDLEQLR